MNPPNPGELEIYNQVTEIFSVMDLAEKIKDAAKERYNVDIKLNHLSNPRIEKESHYYNPTYTKLLKLGLKPTLLTREILIEMLEVIKPYINNVNEECIFRGYQWK